MTRYSPTAKHMWSYNVAETIHRKDGFLSLENKYFHNIPVYLNPYKISAVALPFLD